MATWIERNRLQASDPASQQLAGTWIHDGDAIAQATRYRRALEAAGYRVGPGRLSGNAQIAFAGTAVVAGRHYRFEIDFAREAGGDQRVTLRFLPAAVPAVNRPTSGRCGRSAATGTHPASPADTS